MHKQTKEPALAQTSKDTEPNSNSKTNNAGATEPVPQDVGKVALDKHTDVSQAVESSKPVEQVAGEQENDIPDAITQVASNSEKVTPDTG